jgi:hypothetical protein
MMIIYFNKYQETGNYFITDNKKAASNPDSSILVNKIYNRNDNGRSIMDFAIVSAFSGHFDRKRVRYMA